MDKLVLDEKLKFEMLEYYQNQNLMMNWLLETPIPTPEAPAPEAPAPEAPRQDPAPEAADQDPAPETPDQDPTHATLKKRLSSHEKYSGKADQP